MLGWLVGLFAVQAQPAKDLKLTCSDRSSDLACCTIIVSEGSTVQLYTSVENLTCRLLGELKSITPW